MNKLKNIFKYLLSDNILSFEKELFEIIPELKYEKGFEQRSDWHCYDVWNHTIATINACDKNAWDRFVLLLHDIGKPFSYQDDGNIRHFRNHAKESVKISRNILNKLNVLPEQASMILKLIEMHSNKINVEDITIDNVDFYKRLLKIQICDAKGYEKNHSMLITEELDIIRKEIKLIK